MSKKKSKGTTSMPFTQSVTTVHGTNFFSALKGRSRRLWGSVLVCNILLTIVYAMVIREKFNESQIITQINADCNVNMVPFPAVIICNFNVVSLKESDNIATILKHYKRSELEIQDFLNALPHLINYNKQSRELGNFTQIMDILKHHYYNMDTIMEEVHQNCENLLLYCSFNRKQKRCDNIFSSIKTYEGYCCAFNYAAISDAGEVSFSPTYDEDLEYYDDGDEDSNKPIVNIIKSSESGSNSGLTVVINVEPNDYPPWSPLSYFGAKIMISDPNDYPETTIIYRYITLGEKVEIKVEPMVFQSEPDIRKVDPERRGCWFYDEVVLEHTDRYSYETCNTECRMKTYSKECGCIPFKYPREKSIRICELEDLKCLNNVTVHKSKMDMNCKPVCYMECIDKTYSITSDLGSFLKDDFPYNITTGRNASELAAVQVYFRKPTCNCYKLTLLMDVTYFIATYGGVFSLSFGGSILTLFELAYLTVALLVNAVIRKITKAIRANKHADDNVN